MTTDIELMYRRLLQPSPVLVQELARLDGDILILGAGGKMGPALAQLAKRAVDMAGSAKKIIAVSRFSEQGLEKELNDAGIITCRADLLEPQQLHALPEAPNVLYLAGTKFGTSGKEAFTWAMNTYLPGLVAEKYQRSRIVVFSTGNVYPLTPLRGGGADERLLPAPLGEYAQSCLGRERIFQYHAGRNNTPLLIYRLNYANDASYGVLIEIAKAVREERPVNLAMGHVNVIWQGDANEMALRSLLHCSTPATILNITGPETVSVRWLATEFGRAFGCTPRFVNEEQDTALLSNAAEAFHRFGYPQTPLRTMMNFIVAWLSGGGRLLNKPTHFQERKGQF